MTQVTFGDPRLLERFWSKVSPNPETGCWEWTGAVMKARGGYAAFSYGRRMVYGHRHAYERLVGEVPEGLHLDHLCRVTRCVNPSHLEAVSPRTNMLRGMAPSAVIVRTDRCPRGHSMADAQHLSRGGRQCRTCKNQRDRDWYQRGDNRQKVIRNVAAWKAKKKVEAT